MDKEEPNFSTWGDISDSELVSEAAKIQKKNTKNNNNKKNVASRSLRETSQETKNKCHCKKQIDHRQFSMVHTFIYHRNDAINCSKLWSETTRLRLVAPPLEFGTFYDVISMVYKSVDHVFDFVMDFNKSFFVAVLI